MTPTERLLTEKGIYRFFLDGGYGDVEGIFIAPKMLMDYLNYDAEDPAFVNFGEVLGKHSEVTADISYVKCVSDAPSDIEVFERLELASGVNLLEYIEMEYFQNMEGFEYLVDEVDDSDNIWDDKIWVLIDYIEKKYADSKKDN